MEEVCLNSEPVFDEGDEYEIEGDSITEQGFGIRVSNSWFRSKRKERYRAKLSCSSAGFKKKSEANHPRPETRTGCPAMIVIRLVDSKRWRIVEVELEHNHQVSPQIKRFYKSHKKMILAAKKAQPPSEPVTEVHTIKLYRTAVVDSGCNGYTNVNEGESLNPVDHSKHLDLKEGDAHAVYNYFCRMKLTNPNFFYLMDLDDEGRLRNVFWADARSRAAYGYFCDTVAIDTSCLANKFEIPLISFVGMNHHGQSVLLGCGFLGHESVEYFVWIFRAWLTCMLGRPPQVIITDQCKPLQNAISETLYEDRQRWVPVYLKDTFFAGMIPVQENDGLNAFFDGYIHKHTSFKEFVDKYDLALHRKHLKEAMADLESRTSSFELKTKCNFEVQLSKMYTKAIFMKLQSEVEGMYSCFNTKQVSVNGPIITYMVKERVEVEGKEKVVRHALTVLNYNGVEEIPSRYILPRWSKDFKCRFMFGWIISAKTIFSHEKLVLEVASHEKLRSGSGGRHDNRWRGLLEASDTNITSHVTCVFQLISASVIFTFTSSLFLYLGKILQSDNRNTRMRLTCSFFN
ncbi:Protein FAR1-related sequence 6 [Vitis vinifera]|uniref:Protein FAR1-RELATED SEQUENCE n=1 Tax=Vitis vinifera TaxID=29760 RepID=A0A438KEI4_VITVI|nr:Protein FAR1-related sequence 6 [Vitis vinifera]